MNTIILNQEFSIFICNLQKTIMQKRFVLYFFYTLQIHSPHKLKFWLHAYPTSHYKHSYPCTKVLIRNNINRFCVLESRDICKCILFMFFFNSIGFFKLAQQFLYYCISVLQMKISKQVILKNVVRSKVTEIIYNQNHTTHIKKKYL